MPDRERWARRAHENLMEVNALLTAATPGGAVERSDGELIFRAAHDFPFLSGAMRTGEGDPAALLERAERLLAGPGRGWTAFVPEGDTELAAAARAAGLVDAMRYSDMVRAQPIPEPAPPPGVELRRVEDAATARGYWAVCTVAYRSLQFPDGVFESFPPEMLLMDEVEAWVASIDGEPAATAMIVVVDDVALVAWVATLEARRGQGLGGLCTTRVTNAAFERGVELASLQPSHMGEALYRRLGYEEAFAYRLFMRGAEAA